MATAQIPVKTMLIAMMPGSRRLLYAAGDAEAIAIVDRFSSIIAVP